MAQAIFPDLEGASVFITGGGSGIGAALVDGFLGQGARVAFIDVADCTGFVDRMEGAHGARPLLVRGDVADVGGLQGAAAAAAKAHGTVSVLVNNVADDLRHDTLSVPPAFWDQNQAVNLRSYFFAIQSVVPGMRQVGGRCIVNMASVAFFKGIAAHPSYAAANGGIVALTRAQARELGPANIRVNAVSPGWTMTEKQRALWVRAETYHPYLAEQCLARPVEPEDIVPPVLFLASAASTVITGQVLPVDGGVAMAG